jgi:hypothetical protein
MKGMREENQASAKLTKRPKQATPADLLGGQRQNSNKKDKTPCSKVRIMIFLQ